MLFFIGFGLLVAVLIAIITVIAQPPHRWVERYVERNKSQFPAKKPVAAKVLKD